jgi:hypothetical protein
MLLDLNMCINLIVAFYLTYPSFIILRGIKPQNGNKKIKKKNKKNKSRKR